MSWLQEAKLLLMGGTSLSKDALHIYVGLSVLFVAALLGRWRVGDWRSPESYGIWSTMSARLRRCSGAVTLRIC